MPCRVLGVALGALLATAGCSSESEHFPAAGGHQAATPNMGGSTASGSASASASDTGTDGGTPSAGQRDCQAHERVLTDEVSNARDLVGTPVEGGGTIACGAVFRGGPLRVSSGGCAAVQQLGLRTIIDLRIEDERLGLPDSDCVSAERVFTPLPVPYGLSAADYLNDLHEVASMAAVFHTFGNEAAYPIYFHCTYGRDRTGVVGALLLLTLGASREAVLAEYMLSQPHVGAYPESLRAVIDEIEQSGGGEAVLRSLGITTAELDVMRAKLLAD